jgi:hypothetical protein
MTESAERPSFHVLVLAPLRADEEHATNDAWSEPVRFKNGEFDEAMMAVAPSIEIELQGQRVGHGFRAMRAFRPEVMMEQVSVLRALRAGASNVPPPMSPSKAQSLVDDILNESAPPPIDATLEAFVSHPVVRGLERAWLGLKFLTEHADKEKGVVIEAIDAQADNVDAVLEKLARRIDAAPIDLIVVDHAVGSSQRDRDRLEKWAQLAEGLGAPLVANALPEVLGAESVAAIGKSQARLRSSDHPSASAFRAVAAKDVMRWVCLAMNGPLARAPHRGPVRKTFGVTLEEKLVQVMGPAFAVAALACESFAAKGWPLPPAGVLKNMPVHLQAGASISTEAPANADSAREAAEAGITLLCSSANEDVVAVPNVPTVHRAPSTQGGAAAPATHSLADQLFIARTANAIIQLAAAIPASTPEGAARDVVKLALADLFGPTAKQPNVEVKIAGAPAMLEVTLHPKGFHGLKLEEITLGAPLAS